MTIKVEMEKSVFSGIAFYLDIQSEFDYYRVYENNPKQISRKGY